ncbi:MAG: AAA family ATPase [Gammaproteobacteria bacterium]|nr:AAA family ATPase [Gammaproteobacteria bacterium]
MNVIATYNIKGGVGKTATAVNLAWLAAREGAPTLVWDLDPQGAASYYFRIKPKIKGGGKRLVQGKRDLDDFIRGTDYELLDLLPADFSYRNMDLFLEHSKNPVRQIRKLLKPFKNEYYYVFLDCPPSISLVSENVFTAAGTILVPTIPTHLSLRTYQQISKFFRQQQLDAVKVLPFFSMVDRRKQLHRAIVDKPPGYMENLLQTRIPYNSIVEHMGDYRAPLGEFAPNSRASRCYEALWEDVKRQLPRRV